ncbi:hypothetical protein G7046_g7444 [Stylonectria norvegica]|nr:hypothetical protein G7046_g7444 [Stylonectria norvegica]
MATRTAHTTPALAPGTTIPAQLGFLAIFNPSLGNTDDTIDDQIVYYASFTTQTARQKRRRTRGRPTHDIPHEERNERLRQIGLAQGMASFSRGFAGGAAVDAIDTERARVVLHELEPGWWILASIDLTKVPLPPRLPTKRSEAAEERYEYSSREIKPANLVLRDLLRTHSIFLMHHGSSLSALFVRTKRSKFVAVLSRYWDLFLSTWNVTLHGNPARAVFGGINIAASGELGVGVGEEDRGSGEREVLEGLVGRIEGLADLVVSKFGDDDSEAQREAARNGEIMPWLGTGQEPGAADGAVFLGMGAVSRKSLRDVTHWMEDLYTWGDHAYGVIDSPTSIRRAKRRAARVDEHKAGTPETDMTANATTHGTTDLASHPADEELPALSENPSTGLQDGDEGKLDKVVNYFKLGYGTYWSLPGGSGDSPDPAKSSTDDGNEPLKPARPSMRDRTTSYDASGHFLIGLKGDIEDGLSEQEVSLTSDSADVEHNSRTIVRTLHVELESEATDRPEATIVHDFEHPASILTQSQVAGNMLPGYDSHDLNKAKKLRVVVYVNRPFVFTFLFHLRTDSLAWDTLYRSLHNQLAPLRKPLIASTRYRPERPSTDSAGSSIYDLIWDPDALTVHSSIPNIPDNYLSPEPWSRPDALNTHLHLLTIHAATRPRASDLERTQKTSRGWWIVWARLLGDRRGDGASITPGNLSTIHEGAGSESSSIRSAAAQDDDSATIAREIFLIRRASDHIGFRAAYAEGVGGEGAGRLAQGIGVDTRRYVEELLSLL